MTFRSFRVFCISNRLYLKAPDKAVILRACDFIAFLLLRMLEWFFFAWRNRFASGIGQVGFSPVDWLFMSGKRRSVACEAISILVLGQMDGLAQQCKAKVHDVVGQGAPQRHTFGFL